MFLRTPLTHYSSITRAYFPDETHTSIRRVFSPQQSPNARRVFCGYCGTSLSYWSDVPRGESEYIRVPLGSLMGNALETLEDLGYLAEDAVDQFEDQAQLHAVQATSDEPTLIGDASKSSTGLQLIDHEMYPEAPWFEELVEGSALGRLVKRRGGQRSRDGTTSIEWEVVEWTNDGEGEPELPTRSSTPGGGKRKIGELEREVTMEDTPDVSMRGAL